MIMQYYFQAPELFVGLLFIFNLLIGGFITSIGHTMPKERIMCLPNWYMIFHLFRLRSRCPKCRNQLGLLEVMPILGYIFNRGACKYCKKPISIKYPITELSTALLATGLFIYAPDDMKLWVIVLAWFTVLIAKIDFENFLILDVTAFPLMFLGLLSTMMTGLITIEQSIYGIIIGFIVFFLFQGSAMLVFKKNMFGDGDVKLLAAALAWVGIDQIANLILFASVLALIYSAITLNRQIPFGPFIMTSLLINYFMLIKGFNFIDYLANALLIF